jgi:hypothetical protein
MNQWLLPLNFLDNMNTTEYDKVAYKKYKAYCYLEKMELLESGAEVDCQPVSFEQFLKRINEDARFAKVWGYWNFI